MSLLLSTICLYVMLSRTSGCVPDLNPPKTNTFAWLFWGLDITPQIVHASREEAQHKRGLSATPDVLGVKAAIWLCIQSLPVSAQHPQAPVLPLICSCHLPSPGAAPPHRKPWGCPSLLPHLVEILLWRSSDFSTRRRRSPGLRSWGAQKGESRMLGCPCGPDGHRDCLTLTSASLAQKPLITLLLHLLDSSHR